MVCHDGVPGRDCHCSASMRKSAGGISKMFNGNVFTLSGVISVFERFATNEARAAC